MTFSELLTCNAPIITEGAIIERLRRSGSVQLDRHIEQTGLIYNRDKKGILENIYREYLDVGQQFDLPIILGTPTWRANPVRLRAAGLHDLNGVNRDAFRFLASIRKSYGQYASKIYIGGLMGCMGDAYKPQEALDEDESAQFHRRQVGALAQTNIDFIHAVTLPAASEARGIARAISERNIPYILSFVIQGDGTLLDDTPIHELVTEIDESISPSPSAYMMNCVHPATFIEAMETVCRQSEKARGRIIGLQGNTSRLTPEELNNRCELDTDLPETFAEAMKTARTKFQTRILGGCCGTTPEHISAIAEMLTKP